MTSMVVLPPVELTSQLAEHAGYCAVGHERPLRYPDGYWTRWVVHNFCQNFGNISLVFGCIGADLCK